MQNERKRKIDENSSIVQEVFAAALDWIDAIEKLDECDVEISDEKKIELLEDEFFSRSVYAKK